MSVQQKKMFDPEQQDETYDMDNEFDCEVEKEVKTVKVKEKKIRRLIAMLWKVMMISQKEMVSG